MKPRAITALWLVGGVFLWNTLFDLYISRGAREYLDRQAEFELGREPRPSMTEVMDRARREGLITSSLWAGAVVAGGWLTLAARRRQRS